MRRQDRALGEEEAIRLLQTGEYGVLSVCSADGEPYGVPLSYVYLGGALYFHGALGVGHKVRLLEQNPRACFTVVGKTELLPRKFSTRYESAVAFGPCRPVEEEEERVAALRALVAKYAPGFQEQGEAYIQRALGEVGVYRLSVQRVTAKGRR